MMNQDIVIWLNMAEFDGNVENFFVFFNLEMN